MALTPTLTLALTLTLTLTLTLALTALKASESRVAGLEAQLKVIALEPEP